MYSIQHNLEKIERLNTEDEVALKQWWQGLGKQHDQVIATKIIISLRRKRLWLACECLYQTLENSPLLSPVKAGETYFLRRMSNRARHAKNCTFYDEQVIQKQVDIGNSNAVSPPDWGFEDANIEASQRNIRSKKNFDSIKGSRISTLARRLFWLAEKSGIQDWNARDYRGVTAKVLGYAEKTTAFEDVTLKQILFATESAYSKAWFDSSFSICRGQGIVEGAWWLMPCSRIDKVSNSIQLGNLVLNVAGAIEVFGGDTSPARFPMIAMCQISSTVREGLIERVYLHPAANCGMLVDSDLERETLDDLCDAIRRSTSANSSTRIYKPTINLQENERPDFVVHHNGAKLIIETMGFESSNYKDRKTSLSKTFPNDTVFFDWRTKSEASDRLQIFLASWLSNPRKKAGQIGRL